LQEDSRIYLALKALCELGPRQLGLYAWYKVGLKVGYFRWRTGDGRPKTEKISFRSSVIRHLLDLPDPSEILAVIGDGGLSQLLAEADEIVAGRVRLFGGDPVPQNLTPPGELSHWTELEQGSKGVGKQGGRGDIKFIWEPARFGWAFTLGRAYYLSGDERYPKSFWRYFEIFQEANPVNMGPNWASAQEVALRLIAFVFAAQIFSNSPHSTTPCASQLANSIAHHAGRIPPTLIYARAQNNNHLLSEAAGLITASLALPNHPDSPRWSKLGWKWFNRGLETQITEDGAYMQHSTNYHRLMLQLALWVNALHVCMSASLQVGKSDAMQLLTPNLQLATNWLLSLADLDSGRVPNLGPNDGAYILPLTVLPFHDYRPVLQAASQAFLGETAFDPGPWDEMSVWLCSGVRCQVSGEKSENVKRDVSRSTLYASRSWAYLRAAHFTDRPGHADQLHFDLWWRGLNVAQDAGTYLYNADPPWDNALTHTAVHNTVLVDSQEQMTRAGRFLYLDRAQAEIVAQERAEDGSWERLIAQHDGYQRLGVTHQRTVTAHQDDRWIVEDQLLPANRSPLSAPRSARLHWLLPDWMYELSHSGLGIRIKSPFGWVSISIRVVVGEHVQPATCNLQLIRAGEVLYGNSPAHPTWGWVSPTYGMKVPALSFSITVNGLLPLTLLTEWKFPDD